MSDFPRGWTLTNRSIAAAATITVPAITGVVHVLDTVTAFASSVAAAATSALIELSSSDGTFASFVLMEFDTPPGSTTIQTENQSLTGLDLAAGPGASLTVFFSTFGSYNSQLLVIQGHDI